MNVRPLNVTPKRIIAGLILAALALSLAAAEPKPHSYVPNNGFVPDDATAIAIAVAVWIPVYGREAISSQKPYMATLVNDTWIVEGSLPKEMLGGVARAEIAKKDGRILRVTHGK